MSQAIASFADGTFAECGVLVFGGLVLFGNAIESFRSVTVALLLGLLLAPLRSPLRAPLLDPLTIISLHSLSHHLII